MGAGTAVAQAIPLAAGPLLTRLYDPYEFGLMTSTVALALLLSVVATARYELAIVLPESDRDARALAGAAAILASVVCVAAMALIALAEIVAPAMAGSSRLGPWIAAVPAIAWLMACGQIGNCIANRTRDYPRMAGAAIVQQAVAAAVACLLGVVSAPFNGLIVGRIAGHATYAAAFLQRLRGLIVERTRSWTLAECREAARRYRQFPQYNLPYSLVGSFSRDFIVLALTYRHYVEAAGMYGVARMVVSAPVFFVSSTLTQVFFREASERIGTPAFAALVARLLRTVAFAGAPFMAWLAYWGPELFGGIFGAGWQPAGAYAAALCVPASLHLLSSWTTRTFEVCQQQRMSFQLQMASDALSVIVVLGLLLAGRPPMDAVIGFVVCQVAYHVVCLSLILGLLETGRAVLWRILASVLGMWIVAWLAGAGVAAVLDGPAAILVHLAFAVAIAATMLHLGARVWKPDVTRETG
ncbi:MAG: hypothetical protein HONDAALG_00900 [Gammaproteobacteria bacterium]|nr:hypothetical protein [Gammaproteobacteria bacterium]